MLGRISAVSLLPWESQRSALVGTGFDAQLLLASSLLRTCFSVTGVSLALETRLLLELELKVSIYGFCLTCRPIIQFPCGADGCVGLVTTWLILPVVI